MDNYDYVLLNLQPWETPIGSNARDIARTLAQKNRVLWIDPALDWASKIQDNYKAKLRRSVLQQHQGKRLVEVEPNLWVLYPKVTLNSINWLPDNALYDWFNRYNNMLLAREIRLAIKQLNIEKYIFINDNEIFRGFYLKELLRPALYTYYTRDNVLMVDYWRKHGERLEPMLMKKADLVAGNSAYLASKAAQYNPNVVDVGQGCDLSKFVATATYTEPADLATIPYPRIGYVGALTAMRLDISLIEWTAKAHPDWQIVLVGPEDDEFRASRLHQFPNVHFLGAKPFEEVTAYIQAFNVLINPQLVNDLTIGNYPRKVDEYLAMGKPVVAVRTEGMEMFRKHVLLAETPHEFVDCLEKALINRMPSSADDRINFAHEHTWENSVNALKQAIDNSQAPVS